MSGSGPTIPDHRRSFVRVDLDAITRNVAVIRRHLPPGCAFGAVVKADGYGHGAASVARVALAGGASWLLVATVSEGITLRRAGFADVPILVLGAIAAEEVMDLISADLIPTIDEGSPLDAVAAAAKTMGKAPYPVHVKVDTGLNRFGVAEEHAIAFVRRVSADPRLRVDGLSTHFATADVIGDPFLSEQDRRFAAIVDALAAHRLRPRVVHAANSGAALQGIGCWDMVRVGIAIYGIPPAPGFPMPAGLSAALSVQSRVVRVIDLPVGATVGYGRTYTASRPCRAAVVPIGYADGLSRSLSNRGSLLIGGGRCPIVGNVSMDQCVAALPDGVDAAVDDPVIIVGMQGGTTQTITDLATDAGTIAYELAVRFGARMRREYHAACTFDGG
ncbi:MAG: alanine racemase [Thermomicrobiales bacterium]